MIMHVTDELDQLADAVVLYLPVLNSKQCI